MSFPCPVCGKDAAVLDSRATQDESRFSVYRRRKCPKGHRFTTYEMEVEKRRGKGKPILGSVSQESQVMKDFVSAINRMRDQ